MTPQFQNAIVVGASSGIGEALARQLAAAGTQVALIARRAVELDRVAREIKAAGGKAHVFAHDVREFDATPALFDRIVETLGGLDCLVYASGHMPRVEEGEYDFAKDRAMMEVNALGCIAWCNLAAARFEAARSGTIIGISSIAGERGRRGQPVYCTSKAAMTAYLEALRNRLHRYGVSVVTIKPGFIDTAMTRGMKGLFWLISADECARNILRVAETQSASRFVPWRWSLVAAVVRNVPSFLFRKTNI